MTSDEVSQHPDPSASPARGATRLAPAPAPAPVSPAPAFIGVERVCILDVEPELGRGLDPAELAEHRRATGALIWALPRGRFSCGPDTFDLRGGLGLLIVDGLIVRHLTIGGMEAVELIGPGDVLRPWVEIEGELARHTCEHWTVTRRTRFAILDRAFALAVSPWPEIAANISDRVAMRVGWMALTAAIHGIRRVDRRLLTILWSYADRWGRVTPDGVVLELQLTHRLLAGLIGARRPSVTTALRSLERSGELCHSRERGWLLTGERPPLQVPAQGAMPSTALPSAIANGRGRAERRSATPSSAARGRAARSA